jgi:hypothetical protein
MTTRKNWLACAISATMLIACATSTGHAQSIWSPQNTWALPPNPPGELVVTRPAGSDTGWQDTNRRAVGFQNPPTGGRTGYALVANPVGYAREDGNAINDHIQIALGSYTHSFKLTTNAGAHADIVVPVLTDALIGWGGPAANQARFQLQYNFQLFRQDAPANPGDPLPNTYTAVGGAVAYSSGWLGDPGGGRTRDLSHSLFHRFANQDTGERGYQIRATVTAIAQADSAGVQGAVGSYVAFEMDSANHLSSRGVTFSVSAEPANYQNANSRSVVSAPWARNAYHVDGSGVTIGIIESGKAVDHTSFGARLTRANRIGAPNDYFDREHATAVASIIGSSGGTAAQRGVAPGASMITASAAEWQGTVGTINEMINRFGAGNAAIINFSMSDSSMTGADLDAIINGNSNVSFVWAAGNERLAQDPDFTYVGTVPNPNHAYNNIAVGALDSTFKRMEDYSSNTVFELPTKPEVVAPGSYVLSASTRDLNNNGQLDDFTRTFVANHWSATLNPNFPRYPQTGRISGTSFAAPHVSGILALAHEYANTDPAKYDARAKDQRVMKALLIAGARTDGITSFEGFGWSQPWQSGNLTPSDPLHIPQSLDWDLGGGAADAVGMLKIFSNPEARLADNNNQRNFQIDLRPGFGNRTGFWDLETVGAKADGVPGTVDYLLGGSFILDDFNRVQGVNAPIDYLRVALTWNRGVKADNTYEDLANLELFFFLDGFDPVSITGWDPADGKQDAVDYKIAYTENASENVKLFDFDLKRFWFFGLDLPEPGRLLTFADLENFNFYLQVRNNSEFAVEYGIAASFIRVPTPGGSALLLIISITTVCRRRH